VGPTHGLDPEKVCELRTAAARRHGQGRCPHLEADREAAWIDAVELADIDGLTAVPGSSALLAALPKARWAVVTSCGRPLAERRLTAVGLRYPRSSVTSEDVLQESRRLMHTGWERNAWGATPQHASSSKTRPQALPQGAMPARA